jgi:hypothetical protein
MASTSSSASSSNGTVYPPSYQLGRAAFPAQVLSVGGSPYDVGKSSTSCRMLITDVESLDAIRSYEISQALLHPTLQIESVIDPEVRIHPDTGLEGYCVRIKMTKNEKCYRTGPVPWQSGSALTLHDLAYGHLVLLQCRHQGWVYQGRCGLIIYANLIRGVGASAVPWGLDDKAPSVEWL